MATILVTTSTFPRWADDIGSARFVFDLSLQMAQHHQVIVLAPHAPGAAYHETLNGLDVWRFPYFRPHRLQALCNGGGILPAIRSGLLPKCQVPFLFLNQLFWLNRMVRRFRVDLINSHWMIPQGFTTALLKKRFPGIPHLLTVHSSDVHTLRRLAGGGVASRFIVNSADRVVTVSRFLHRTLENLVGKEVDSRIMPMGVNTAAFTRHVDRDAYFQKQGIADKPTILYVGKLIEVKGIATLIQAMKQVRATCDVQLLIVGAGALQPELEREVQTLSLNEDIHFLGPLPHDHLADLYNVCDVAVVPSIVTDRNETEGMPTVILEAMAAGRPVVASDVGGISDVVVDAQNGFLVPPKDPQALADRLVRALDPDIAAPMREQVRKTAHQYDWQQVGQVYDEIIRDLTSRKCY